MKKRQNVLKQVNEIYKKKNPSEYVKTLDLRKIRLIVENRKKFLLEKLKLPSKIFQNSELLDLGSGSGQNTIFYDWYGASCTLVEYDKKSFLKTKKLFNKFGRKKTTFVNKDLFKFKTKKKFDFVVSNGVAHHTHDVKKNIINALKFLKPGGMLILGIGETNGFFQRHFQRHILFKISKNKDDLIKLSKILFKENLIRAKKYGGRTEEEIIYDSYLNPKIHTLSFNQIQKIFSTHKIYLYSLDEDYFNINKLNHSEYNQFSLLYKKKDFHYNDFSLATLNNFFLTNPNTILPKKEINKFYKIDKILNELTGKYNNQRPNILKNTNSNNKFKSLKSNIKKLEKISLIDKKGLLLFISEILKVKKILKIKDDRKMIGVLKRFLKKNKKLFKKFNGKGMNYFVGYKK